MHIEEVCRILLCAEQLGEIANLSDCLGIRLKLSRAATLSSRR